MSFDRLRELLDEGTDSGALRGLPLRPTILIIDDDEHIRRALAMLLGERYEIRAAASGPEGISVCDGAVSAVLLDVKMSGMDGFETSRGLRQKHERVPIIFHTGYQDAHDPITILNEYRPFGYVVKGADPQRLLATLDSAVAFSEKLRENQRLVSSLQELNATLERRVEERTRQLEESLTQITRLTVIDFLTEIANRRHFFSQLEQERKRVDRHQMGLCLLLIDVDDFKPVNERFGHPAGDVALRAIAQALKHAVRDVDSVGRIGGEEFGVLLPSTDLEGMTTVAGRLLEAVRALQLDEVPGQKLSISIGGCHVAGPPAPRESSLYDCADQALRAAKQSGKDRFHLMQFKEDG